MLIVNGKFHGVSQYLMLCVFYFKTQKTSTKTTQKRQLYNIKELNQNLVIGKAIIVQADKGKTIVIINAIEYSKKLHTLRITVST